MTKHLFKTWAVCVATLLSMSCNKLHCGTGDNVVPFDAGLGRGSRGGSSLTAHPSTSAGPSGASADLQWPRATVFLAPQVTGGGSRLRRAESTASDVTGAGAASFVPVSGVSRVGASQGGASPMPGSAAPTRPLIAGTSGVVGSFPSRGALEGKTAAVPSTASATTSVSVSPIFVPGAPAAAPAAAAGASITTGTAFPVPGRGVGVRSPLPSVSAAVTGNFARIRAHQSNRLGETASAGNGAGTPAAASQSSNGKGKKPKKASSGLSRYFSTRSLKSIAAGEEPELPQPPGGTGDLEFTDIDGDGGATTVTGALPASSFAGSSSAAAASASGASHSPASGGVGRSAVGGTIASGGGSAQAPAPGNAGVGGASSRAGRAVPGSGATTRAQRSWCTIL